MPNPHFSPGHRKWNLARILHEGGSSRRSKSMRSISCTTFPIKARRGDLPLFGFRTKLAVCYLGSCTPATALIPKSW